MQLNIRKSIALLLSAAALSVGSIGLSQPEVKAFTALEASFLNDVSNGLTNNGYGEVVANVTPATLLEIGQSACDALNGGLTLDQVTQTIANSITRSGGSEQSRSVASHVMGYTIATGIQYFCPEHYDQVHEISSRTNESYYAQPSNATGQWAYLTASDRSLQINMRSTPSLGATAPYYGLVGDRVWVSYSDRADGFDWYLVSYPSTGKSGWVPEDFLDFETN